MSKQEYQDHPLSSVLPLMGQMEIRELAADIQLNGQLAPITLLDGKILDGRNRYRACQFVGIEPKFRDFNGEGDPIDFILSVNVKRRHLTASQKAMVIAKISQLPRGNPKLVKSAKTPTNSKSPQNGELGKTAAQAAKEIGVGHTTVEEAKKVLREGSKDTIKQVERGEKSVATAVKEIKKAKPEKTSELDKTGYPIPDSILEDWQRAETRGRGWLSKLSQIRSELRSDFEEKDIIVAAITNTVLADLNNAYSSLKCVVPYAVCTSCQGHQRKKCGLCKGRGFLDDFAWKSFVPAEMKTMRENSK